MSEIRFTHRLRYAFDNSMSKGAIALIGIPVADSKSNEGASH